jgi:multiple sugar transport system substrate-binding protein
VCHATTGGRTHALLRWSGEQIVRYALVDNALQHPTARGAGWIAANGGKVFDLPDNPTKFMMDMPETIEALQYLQDLIWEHQIVPPIAQQGGFGFATGLCAMTIEGTGMMSRYLALIGDSFEMDLARRPMGKVGRGYYLASDMFGISAGTKTPEASWHFLHYLVSKEAAEAYAKIMSRGPVRRSAFAAYQKEYAGHSIQIYAEGMMDSVISPETQMYKVTEARNNLIWKAVRDQVVPKKKTAKQAILEIAEAVRALYK